MLYLRLLTSSNSRLQLFHRTIPPTEILVCRHRANYYKDKNSWIVKKLKAKIYRDPKCLYRWTIYLLVGTAFLPSLYYMVRARLTLSKDEFIDYHNKYKAVIQQRARSGDNMYIPFYSKNIAVEQDEMTDEVYIGSHD